MNGHFIMIHNQHEKTF